MKRQIELHNLRQEDTRRAELGKVDFSKRREKIQQAFNRTVQESARKEEYKVDARRRAMARQSKPNASSSSSSSAAPDQEDATASEDLTVIPNGVNVQQDTSAPRGDHTTPSHSGAVQEDEDSPAVGSSDLGDSLDSSNFQSSMDNSFFDRRASSASATSSAATIDTYVTTFDTEPPADPLRQSPQSHRTLLNHIMQMRESSTSSPSTSSDVPDYTFWDSDDKGSARVSVSEILAYDGESYPEQQLPINGMPGRWSMSSWSSYVQHENPTITVQDTQEPVSLGTEGLDDTQSGYGTNHLGVPENWKGAPSSVADWVVTSAAEEIEQDDSTETRDVTTPTPQAADLEDATQAKPPPSPRVNGDEQSNGHVLEAADEPSYPPIPEYTPPLPPPPISEKPVEEKSIPCAPRSVDEASDNRLSEPDQLQRTDSSENSSLFRQGHGSSSQAHSSATSLLPPGSEQASLDAKRASPSPEQHRVKMRRHVIKELVDTEYTFGKDMKVVDDIYKGTSSSCLDLSADDVKILFANSDQIVQFSVVFQDALRAASKSVYVIPKSQRWGSKRSSRKGQQQQREPTKKEQESDAPENSDLERDRMTKIGHAFVTYLVQMEKVYADYLKNHDAANAKLQALQRNAKVAIWLKECREWASDLTSAWDLDSLLVKPVQRILKYPLLLKQLLDLTPADHPDHAAIASALEGVTEVSVRINEMKKRADVVEQVVGRKRKESDVRAGLSKAFGRQTEKLRHQVGLSDASFEDKNYDILAQKIDGNLFQLRAVMRDVETYTQEIQASMGEFADFVMAVEGYLDVAASPAQYAELENKWRRFRSSVDNVVTVLLSDHVSTVFFFGLSSFETEAIC